MKTQILMVTHGKDLAWAEYSLRSIAKYGRGFDGMVVVVPEKDAVMFNEIASPLGIFVGSYEEAHGKGMLGHMAMKMQADIILPDADFILHMDADCMMTEPVSPSDYIIDGKPIIVRERYSEFQHHPNRKLWQGCVENAVGWKPEWETMVRHPHCYLRSTYQAARHLIFEHTGVEATQYILGCKNEYPQTFAEFPTLGAVAIQHFYDSYHFIDHSDGGRDYEYKPGRDKIKAFWSHGGIDKHRDELEAIIS